MRSLVYTRGLLTRPVGGGRRSWTRAPGYPNLKALAHPGLWTRNGGEIPGRRLWSAGGAWAPAGERETVSARRIPKNVFRARMAKTAETYQQAHAAPSKQIPYRSALPIESVDPCADGCLSQYLQADLVGVDGGSLVDC